MMQVKKRRFSRLKIALAVFAALLVLLAFAFVIYTSLYYKADAAARGVVVSC